MSNEIKPLEEENLTPQQRNKRERDRRYYYKNKNKRSETNKIWYQKNKDKKRDYYCEYYKANKQKLNKSSKKYYEENKNELLEKGRERGKIYYNQNKERISKQQKERYNQNKEAILNQRKEKLKRATPNKKARKKTTPWEKSKAYYYENREARLEYSRNWYQNNKKRKHAARHKNHKKRLANDELYAAKYKIRMSVASAFQRIKKNKPTNTLNLLGCTWLEAKAHIENLFEPGMSWKNLGEWHVDHIRPVSSFALNELHLMNDIQNLQPLWAKDNISKSDKIL